jgi:hypothetical protein
MVAGPPWGSEIGPSPFSFFFRLRCLLAYVLRPGLLGVGVIASGMLGGMDLWEICYMRMGA